MIAIRRYLFGQLQILLFFTIFVSMMPMAFLGVDFTDFGYHYVNQLRFLRFQEFLHNSSLYILSDLIPGSIQHLLQLESFLSFKIFGVILWSLIGVSAFYLFKELTQRISIPLNSTILMWCCVPAVLISAKPITTGALLIPDYYTVPLLIITWAILLLLNYMTMEVAPLPNVLISFLLVLPLFRWPLFLFSIPLEILVLTITCTRRLKYKYTAVMIFFLGIFGPFILKFFLIDRFSVKLEGSHNLKLLLEAYFYDFRKIGKILFFLVTFYIFTSVTEKISNHLVKRSINGGLVAVCTLYALFKTTYLTSDFPFTIVILSALYLLLIAVRQLKQGKKNLMIYLAISVFALLTYPLGSNTGLIKMGYLSFLFIGPALYLYSSTSNSIKHRKIFLFSVNVIAIFYLYNSLYREDLNSILKSPTIYTDSTLGTIITTQKNKLILDEFKMALNTTKKDNAQIIISPYAPLLAAYVSDYDIRISWPEIRAESFLSQTIESRCFSSRPQLLFLLKSNTASPTREALAEMTYDFVPRIWKKFCGWNVIYQGKELLVVEHH